MHDLEVTANTMAAEKIALEERLQEMEQRLKRERLVRVQAVQIESDWNIQYPPWWDLEQLAAAKYGEAVLIDLPLHGEVANEVVASFMATADHKVVRVQGVMNRMLYDRWWNEKRALTKSVGEHQVNERRMFHGTRSEQTMQIVVREGFRKVFNQTARYGFGTYLAKNAKYSVDYSSNSNGIRKMFRCNVLCGESHRGHSSYALTAWPKKANGLIYDSLIAGDADDPSIVVIHENSRLYPMFIIHFLE